MCRLAADNIRTVPTGQQLATVNLRAEQARGATFSQEGQDGRQLELTIMKLQGTLAVDEVPESLLNGLNWAGQLTQELDSLSDNPVQSTHFNLLINPRFESQRCTF